MQSGQLFLFVDSFLIVQSNQLPTGNCILLTELIVTLLTFQTADIFHRQAVHFSCFEIVMELFVNAVEFVAGAVVVVEGNF
jgi:hypothetical protein